MEPVSRLSMNTSLKNARIFDDDAWDDEEDCSQMKIVIKAEPKQTVENSNVSHAKVKVKKEPKDKLNDSREEGECDDTFLESEHSFCDRLLKQEDIKIKVTQNVDNNEVKYKVIKQENDTSEGECENSFVDSESSSYRLQAVKEERLYNIKPKTPTPPKISLDPDAPVDNMFDESPYNKELFNTLKIKEQTPIKTENEDINERTILKSAKRTVFSRHSPYKKFETDIGGKRAAIKSRLGPEYDSDEEDEYGVRPEKRSRQEFESDPVVIARREKQIEYGKNTIGYENYIKVIPKSERRREDPQTPPKMVKYSRRGWEGLVKQWRIKLHKFDPPEEST